MGESYLWGSDHNCGAMNKLCGVHDGISIHPSFNMHCVKFSHYSHKFDTKIPQDGEKWGGGGFKRILEIFTFSVDEAKILIHF